MKNVSVLDLGGELKTGDMIAIGDGTMIELAWYVSSTPSAMKVIPMTSPTMTKTHYDSYASKKVKADYLTKRFGNGFNFECIGQSLIYNTYCRAIKIANPSTIIQNKHVLKQYEESKQILIDFKFPAK